MKRGYNPLTALIAGRRERDPPIGHKDGTAHAAQSHDRYLLSAHIGRGGAGANCSGG